MTVPSEVQLEEALERKMAKYEGLASKYRSSGWKNQYNPMNVGCRGFAGQLLHRALKALRVMGPAQLKSHQKHQRRCRPTEMTGRLALPVQG